MSHTSLQAPNVEVGSPVRSGAISVFPLFADSSKSLDYRLLEDAIASSTLVIEEISEDGQVSELLADNRGETRVLLLEGEELVGAKQNRVLNTSVLIRAQARVRIPVSCVEQGRWKHTSRHFSSGGRSSSRKLRYQLKRSVSESLIQKKGHQSDQRAVWREVQRQQQSLGATSITRAMSDTFIAHQKHIAEAQDTLKPIANAKGFATAIAGNVCVIDLFDKPETCHKVWTRLLSGIVLDAIEAGPSDTLADADAVRDLISNARLALWTEVQPVGDGREFRAEFLGSQGSALFCDGVPIHVSIVSA